MLLLHMTLRQTQGLPKQKRYVELANFAGMKSLLSLWRLVRANWKGRAPSCAHHEDPYKAQTMMPMLLIVCADAARVEELAPRMAGGMRLALTQQESAARQSVLLPWEARQAGAQSQDDFASLLAWAAWQQRCSSSHQQVPIVALGMAGIL